MEIKLWDRPQLAASFKQLQGRSIIELINQGEGHVVVWHVKNHSWVLSDDAKDFLAEKQKRKAFSHTGYKKHSNSKFY
jgi:hypothetical protein